MVPRDAELAEPLAVPGVETVEQGVVLVPDTRHGDDAGGFLDHEHVEVLVQHPEGHACVGFDVRGEIAHGYSRF